MIQITQFPIIKSICYEITTVLKVKNGGFHDTFSADHGAKPNPQFSDMTTY